MKLSLVILTFGIFYFNISLSLALSVEGCKVLSNGKQLCNSTLNVRDASELAIFGHASYENVAKQVAQWGLKPIRMGSSNKAIVIADFINYKITSIGPYREFILTFPVQKLSQDYRFNDINEFILNSGKITNDPANPQIGYYMHKLVLDGENRDTVDFAILAGRETVGFPKESGFVQMDIESYWHGLKSASVKNEDNTWSMSFDMVTYLSNFLKGEVKTDTYQFMTGLGSLSYTRAQKSLTSTLPMTAQAWENRMQYFGNIDGFDLNDLVFEKWLYVSSFGMEFNQPKSLESNSLKPVVPSVTQVAPSVSVEKKSNSNSEIFSGSILD